MKAFIVVLSLLFSSFGFGACPDLTGRFEFTEEDGSKTYREGVQTLCERIDMKTDFKNLKGEREITYTTIIADGVDRELYPDFNAKSVFTEKELLQDGVIKYEGRRYKTKIRTYLDKDTNLVIKATIKTMSGIPLKTIKQVGKRY